MKTRLALLLCLLSLAAVRMDSPPSPPGFRVSLPVLTPKAKELKRSLGSPMKRTRFAASLPQFTITNISISTDQITLAWQNGSPPYQVVGSASFGQPWNAAGPPTMLLNQSFPVGTNALWKIQGAVPLLFVNETNQPRVTWIAPTIDMSDSLQNFTLQRSTDNSSFTTIATPGPSVTNYPDPTPIPSSGFWYRLQQSTVNGVTIPYPTRFVAAPNAQPGTRNWVKRGVITSGGGQARIFGSTTDNQGNMIVVGSFKGTLNFGDGSSDITSTSGSFDAFIVKYSSSGVVQWVRSFGSTYDDGAAAAYIDSQDNIIVTGYYGSTVNFGGITKTATTPDFGTVPDVFIAKYTKDNALVWVTSMGGGASDAGFALTIDHSDNVLFAAAFASTGANFGSFPLSTAGANDVAIGKLSGASGAVTWATRFGGAGQDIPYGIAADPSGNLLVTGQFVGTVNFGGGNRVGTGPSSAFIAKYSGVNGAYIWDVPIISGQTDVGYGIACDANGTIVVSGQTGAAASCAGVSILSTSGRESPGGIYFCKLTSSGACTWARSINFQPPGGGVSVSQYDTGNAVAIDSSGNIFITGGVVSNVTFDGNVASYGSGGGTINLFVASYNSNGIYRWAIRTSDTFSNLGSSISISGGNINIGGYFSGTTVFSTNPDVHYTAQVVNAFEPIAVQYTK